MENKIGNRDLQWVNDVSMFEEVQKEIEYSCGILLSMFFLNASDYEKEKWLKEHTDKFRYLEKLLLSDRNASPGKYDYQTPPEVIYDAYKEVRRIMLSEVKRSHRHASSYLSRSVVIKRVKCRQIRNRGKSRRIKK